MKLKPAASKGSKAKPAATGRYSVALHGFSDFERNALTFCLKHAAAREPAYVHVERAAQADFIVADASHEALASSVTRGPRMRDTLFVGEHAPAGARSQVERPIDPEQILRALDEMAAEREAPPAVAERPDIVLPMAPPADSDFPTLSEFDIIETIPAAFEQAPVLINLAGLEPTQAAPQDAAPPAAVGRAPAATGRTRAASALKPAEFETIAPMPKAASTPAEAPVATEKRPMTAAERAEAKAAARRRSRRARLAQAGGASAELLRDVLLLGPEREDAGLAAQLEGFGFRVHPTIYSSDALALISELPLAAVFLDVAASSDEDMYGLELCMEIKQQRVLLAGAVPPVFLLANRDSAAGRVRAELAGCDDLLIRPVTRGDAARALEACDVALPSDERRIERS